MTPSSPALRRNLTAAALLTLAACGGTTASETTPPAADGGGTDGGHHADAGPQADGGPGGGGVTCGAAGSKTACVPEAIGTVTTSAGGITSIADDATNVYVGDEGGQIQAIAVATGTSTVLGTPGTTNDGTWLAVGSTDVFFASGGTVGSVPKTGGTVTTLVSGENSGLGLAASGTTLVWSESYTPGATGGDSGQIFTLSGSGGSPTSLASKLFILYGPITDGTNAYWINDGSIESVPLAGGVVTTLAGSEQNAGAIATDGVNVYWAEDNAQIGGCGVCPPPPAPTSTDSSLYEVPVAGGPKTLVSHGYRIDVLAVDDTNLYWFDSTEQTLSTVATRGGSPFVLANNVTSENAPLVDTAYIYWISDDAKLMRLPKQAP